MRPFLLFSALLPAAALLAACGGLQKQVVLSPETTEKVVEMKASSFSFEPNNLKAYAGDTLVFRIESLSDIGHNFTITGPDGEVITEVDLPANETAEATVELKGAGIYGFYCDKPLHKSLGMRGQVVVVERP